MAKNLFNLMSTAGGRTIVDRFASKAAAMRALSIHNAHLKEGQPPYFVAPGDDHWRTQAGIENVPTRGREPVWVPTDKVSETGHDLPALKWVNPKVKWLPS